MSTSQQQFIDLYYTYRHRDQREGFYKVRCDEFQRSYRNVVYGTAALMFLTAASATLASSNALGLQTLWAILSVAFPAISTAVTAVNELYSYNRLASLYEDAANSLFEAEAKKNNADAAPNDPTAVADYVNTVETILRKEQGQWGQLVSEIKLADSATAENGAGGGTGSTGTSGGSGGGGGGTGGGTSGGSGGGG